ncbi:hypothetical protein [Ornithinimicrobium sp. CNJ-824]|uniref:hypothetical protein n=1 Tax=Ornithinimicrobium sp. CNJ-824 TaxID=1904966 RepID=UPI00118130D0|nr:hypothetical protein [Ornithinimicrobium sp. CNJ-824]
MFFPPEDDPGAAAEDHVPRGLDVIQVGHRRGAVVVGLSIGNVNRFPDLENDAKNAGAHLFAYRQKIQDPTKYGWAHFSQDIADLVDVQYRVGDDRASGVSASSDHILVFVALAAELDVLKGRWGVAE